MTARKTTTPAPPADAVNADAHWKAKLEKLRARTRPTLTLTICDDEDIKQAATKARYVEQQAVIAAQYDPKNREAQTAAKKASEALADAQRAFDAASITLHFQALPRDDFKELLAAHPPTESQVEEGYDYNPDTMGPVLIAASCLDPITEQDAAQFLTDWSKAEAETLLNTALAVQRKERMDLGKG
jgi:hypothetical protein